jgi:catechol 2,3-dioxygenase-like lactoylglutathione lyase family enzyme
MIDHVSLRVQDFERALTFYKAALAPLGYSVLMEFPGAVGMGMKGKADFWLTKTDKTPASTHIAILADRDQIDAFHVAAIAAGGTDFGKPGLRAEYHPGYYGAFILDPEGNNIEAVNHGAPIAAAAAKPAARAKAAGKKAVKKAKQAVKKAVKSAKKAVKTVKKPAKKAAKRR